MAVVYQGEPGAYSEAAALGFDAGARTSGLPTFRRVFEAVASGAAARGVVPVENSVGGSIAEVVDGLVAFDGLAVVGERWERIEHALLAPEGTLLEEVREVHSHPQALRQCAASLRAMLPQAELAEAADTAGAARRLAKERPAGVAAIASLRAAELYGLAVLAANVESEATNVTRFLLIAPGGAEPLRGTPMKTTLVLAPRAEVPNALFRSLTAFVGRRLRVHRIEPRPRVGRPGAYRYLVDVEGDAGAEPLKGALADLPALNDEVRTVGSYAAEPIPAAG